MQSPLIDTDALLELPNPPADARIPYGEDSLQFGDLRLPETDGPHPVVVVIHGGCWRSQYDIDHIGSFSDALTRTGVATWTIEYRRVGNPGGGWPGTFQDVGSGLDYLRVLAGDYPLDLARVVVVGHSAGGHLALWLAARAKLANGPLSGKNPLPVRGVVSLAGVDDLRRALTDGVCGDMAARLVGGAPEEFPERYAQTSPIELLPFGVSLHLINGARDPIVPEAFGQSFRSAAERAGDSVQRTVVPDAGHFELIVPTTPAFETVKNAVWGLLQ